MSAIYLLGDFLYITQGAITMFGFDLKIRKGSLGTLTELLPEAISLKKF